MVDGRFFGQGGKRGELQELREELHSTKLDKKREGVRKVIAAMTVGKDVSSLFPDVINCMQTQSLDLKKLVYLYVVNYSATQPELAILAVNTFRKDSLDPNPLIRALAVRTMGCIRLDAVTEYILEPLRRCCRDDDPYVRKTAVMCIAKLYEIQAELVEEHGFAEILRDLTMERDQVGVSSRQLATDSNPAVVANCVAALTQMSRKNPAYLQLTDQSIQNLLHALNECTEWGQVFILDSLVSYNPPTTRAAEAILERVAPRLAHANHAVVMSTIRVFLKFLDLLAEGSAGGGQGTGTTTPGEVVHKGFLRKLAPPLITLLNGEPEIQFVTLRNLNLVVRKKQYEGLFCNNNDVKIFFCKYNDPIYVKMEKLDLLALLLNGANLQPVLTEMRDYASEIDVDFVRKTIKTLGRMAVKLEAAAEPCVNLLLDLMETQVHYVIQEATVVMTLIFRCYPGKFEAAIQTLCDNIEVIDEPEAKASLVWVLGEYAERIDHSDDILAEFMRNFHDEPAQVKTVLLTAVVKLFLKNPGPTQAMVTQCLKLCTEEADDPDLRDRGYMYWRLLSSDPKITKAVVIGQNRPRINDDISAPVHDRLIHGWGTLSSVYRQLPEAFLARRVDSASAGTDDNDTDDDEAPERLRQLQEEMRKGRSGSASSGRFVPPGASMAGSGAGTTGIMGAGGTVVAAAAGGASAASSSFAKNSISGPAASGASPAPAGFGASSSTAIVPGGQLQSVEDSDEESGSDGEGSGSEEEEEDSEATSDSPPRLELADRATGSTPAGSGAARSPQTQQHLQAAGGSGTSSSSTGAQPQPRYALVLADSKLGKGGNAGLKIATSLVRRGHSLALYIALQNNSGKRMTQFALQLNKNGFGLAVGREHALASLEMLESGEAKTLVIPVLVNPANQVPLPRPEGSGAALEILDAALKSSLDLWYFKLPFEFATVLVPEVPLPQAQYDSNWLNLGKSPAKETTKVILDALPTSAPSFLPTVLRRFREKNLIFVAHAVRAAGESHVFQIGGCTVNKLAFFAEVAVRGSAAQLKTRTDHAALVPAIQGLFEKALKRS